MNIEKISPNSYRIRKMYKGKNYTLYFDHKPTQKEITISLSDKMQDAYYGQNKALFGACCDKYIESKENVLSPSTIAGYKKIKRAISEEFKSKNIYDIETFDIQNEINNYSSKHSAKSVRNLHGFISSVLKLFRPNMNISTSLPQKRKYERIKPTESDVKTILEASKGTEYHIPFSLAVLGMRRSEICGASASDLSGNILHIHSSKVDSEHGFVTKSTTKTEESTRDIYIPDALAEEIRKAGTIFDKTPSLLLKELHRIQKENNIPQFRLHDLRSYFASYAHSQGIPDVYIMKMGGWKTDYVMKNIYRDTLSEKEEEMQQKIVSEIL